MDNPLEKRYLTLWDGWQTFVQLPDARLCRWLFKTDETWFLDSLLADENSPNARIEAFFITLRLPCRSVGEYWFLLARELDKWVLDYAQNPANPHRISWTTTPVMPGLEAPGQFLQILKTFAALIRPHHSGPLVLCLLPAADTDLPAFGRFLTGLLRQPLPTGLRILIRDDHEKPGLDALAKSLEGVMHSAFMDMNLPDFYNKAMTGGDPNDPANQIRTYQRQLTLALVNDKDIPEGERIAASALKLCDDKGWYSLAASIHLSVGYAYFERDQFREALVRYEQALNTSEPAYRNGDLFAGYMTAVGWMSFAAIYEKKKDRPQIEQYYQQAAERAVEVKEPIMAVECLRRLIDLYRAWDRPRPEADTYDRLFALTEKLTPAQRIYSRLPEVGSDYYKRQSTHDARQQALRRVRTLLGPDWEP
jgi:hypothetical protein